MAKKLKKAGTAGRYGARYGVVVRNRVKNIEKDQRRRHECPQCNHVAVSRVCSGVWECRRCGNKFAAGAYNPRIRRSIPRSSAE